MSALTHDDLDMARALWEEWAGGSGFQMEVVIVGEHQAPEMDPDRPLGAILKAGLSLRLRITTGDVLVFDEACPYDSEALRASVMALARQIAER